MLHRFGRRLGLHELLKRGKVGDLDDHPNALRALRVLERAKRLQPRCAAWRRARRGVLRALPGFAGVPPDDWVLDALRRPAGS